MSTTVFGRADFRIDKMELRPNLITCTESSGVRHAYDLVFALSDEYKYVY